MQVDLASGAAADHFGQFFAEELGLVLEVDPSNEQQVLQAYTDAGLPVHVIGSVIADAKIDISVNSAQQISGGATAPECLSTSYCQCRLRLAALAALWSSCRQRTQHAAKMLAGFES